MELRIERLARLRLAPRRRSWRRRSLAPARHGRSAVEPELPPSQTEPPRFFERSAEQASAIAARAEKVREERGARPARPRRAYTRGAGRWQVSCFRDGDEVVQVRVDDASGAILEQWTGRPGGVDDGARLRGRLRPQAERAVRVDPALPAVPRAVRRPAPAASGCCTSTCWCCSRSALSHVFFNRGEIGLSVPLVYPVLLYLLVAHAVAGFRGRASARAARAARAPVALARAGSCSLVAFRVGLNVADSNVIDVGYAGVIGADRIVDGDELYGEGFSEDVEHGDTYGPVNYLLYVPFEQVAALERALGRPARRPRGRDRASTCW